MTRTVRGAGCRLRAGEQRWVRAHVAPADGGAERLAQRLHDAVARALGELQLPGSELAGHALELAQPDVAKGARGVHEPLAQRDDCARAHADGVALEVELDEFGERELGRRRRLAA